MSKFRLLLVHAKTNTCVLTRHSSQFAKPNQTLLHLRNMRRYPYPPVEVRHKETNKKLPRNNLLPKASKTFHQANLLTVKAFCKTYTYACHLWDKRLERSAVWGTHSPWFYPCCQASVLCSQWDHKITTIPFRLLNFNTCSVPPISSTRLPQLRTRVL